MSAEALALRAALGRFATGVTVVTCHDDEIGPVGLTVNSFSALSLHPALVLWSLRSGSQARASFERAGHFAINVLAEGQVVVSQAFASAREDRFSVGQWSRGAGESPVLAGAVAQFECATHSVQEVGDHLLFIGRVLAARHTEDRPLVFQAGRYQALGAHL